MNKETPLSDEYLKGWADGKKETLIVQNRKVAQFVKAIEEEKFYCSNVDADCVRVSDIKKLAGDFSK